MPFAVQQASCGTCGGEGCSGRGNGQNSCCTKNIAANGETCSKKGAAPCIVDDDIVTPGKRATSCGILPAALCRTSCFAEDQALIPRRKILPGPRMKSSIQVSAV